MTVDGLDAVVKTRNPRYGPVSCVTAVAECGATRCYIACSPVGRAHTHTATLPDVGRSRFRKAQAFREQLVHPLLELLWACVCREAECVRTRCSEGRRTGRRDGPVVALKLERLEKDRNRLRHTHTHTYKVFTPTWRLCVANTAEPPPPPPPPASRVCVWRKVMSAPRVGPGCRGSRAQGL
jgi:hypothetical protein